MKYKKNIIVTGAAGFLGSNISERLIKKNYFVYAVDINLKKLKLLEKKFDNETIKIAKVDLTKQSEIINFFKSLSKKKVKINGLINNAAIDAVPYDYKKKIKLNIDSWNKEIEVGLTAAHCLSFLFAEQIRKDRFSIINIGSDLSKIAPNQKIYRSSYKNYFKPASYSAIKHGLLGLTKYYASTYADKGIVCNMISPGPIDKNINNKLTAEIKALIPMNKLISINNILSAIEFLLDEECNFITGQNILIDGGRTII